MNRLAVNPTPIPGLLQIDLVLHDDRRGWFKENFHRQKLAELGLPGFEIVQNNFSFNEEVGVTRGLHAEPWDKYVSVANGRIFGAWVDLRAGPDFGKTFSLEMGPDKAVYVPRGVANGYQTLTPNLTYAYLVNEHWSPDAKYTLVNLFDPTLAIAWPIPQRRAIVSEKDAGHPFMRDIKPMEF